MEWVAIIQMIIQMIQQCNEERNSAEILVFALNRPLGRWMIRQHLRDNGVKGRRLRSAMSQVRARRISDKEIEAFIENALAA